jgi:hypothetical protein
VFAVKKKQKHLMKAKFDLPQPGNWISFEALCLKVWGVLWEIPNEIDFNSTNSQGQNGVDIYGIPKGAIRYSGVQCKSKRLKLKNGGDNKLTSSVIKEEIEKAMTFNPPLQHLVIATSLYRDKAIEEYVRTCSEKSMRTGGFSVQIAFWDYIADKIQDSERLCSWYLQGQYLLSGHSVNVTFDNGERTKIYQPEYVREHHRYLPVTSNEYKLELEEFSRSIRDFKEEWLSERTVFQKIRDKVNGLFSKKIGPDATVSLLINGVPAEDIYPRESIRNREYKIGREQYEYRPSCSFSFLIENTGARVIEDYKLQFVLSGEFKEFEVVPPTVTEGIRKTYQRHSRALSANAGQVKPLENFLVQHDRFKSYRFCVSPLLGREATILVNWNLIARDFSASGQLQLEMRPEYQEQDKLWYIRAGEKAYEEYIYSHIWKEGPRPMNI